MVTLLLASVCLPLRTVWSITLNWLSRLRVLANLLPWYCILTDHSRSIFGSLHFHGSFVRLACHVVATTGAVVINILASTAKSRDAHGDYATAKAAKCSCKTVL